MVSIVYTASAKISSQNSTAASEGLASNEGDDVFAISRASQLRSGPSFTQNTNTNVKDQSEKLNATANGDAVFIRCNRFGNRVDMILQTISQNEPFNKSLMSETVQAI